MSNGGPSFFLSFIYASLTFEYALMHQISHFTILKYDQIHSKVPFHFHGRLIMLTLPPVIQRHLQTLSIPPRKGI